MNTAVLVRLRTGAALALALTGCAQLEPGAPPPPYSPEIAVAGSLRAAGADTMAALLDDWSNGFGRHHPRASVHTDRRSTLSAQGMAALLDGQADIVTFVREPFDSERAAFQARFGYPLSTVRVAGGSYATKGGTHAIAVYVHASNPLSSLTLAELDGVFSRTLRRGAPATARTWGDLGLGGAWRDRPVNVYGMLTRRASGNPPGIVNFMNGRVLLGGEWRADLREQVDREGEQSLAAIVARVAGDPNGIGYSGFGYARAGVKTLALAEAAGTPYYAGTRGEVARLDYPLSRSIYLGFNAPPGMPLPPLMREFLRFVLSAEGQAAIARDRMAFIPQDGAQAARARAAIP
ncbi:PstS family phosphate ABC transporter substrate-binding protein [Massilia cavernae]|uniref:PBP domain-containing protein n=1 Tax=Massilia cavernae TaxID=2320864 RepID=A0A418XFN3_9BURK|nr:substrate-binding domain-containing protein [Massilia cavernae]RJG11272.1 hypothetical protein D3872_20630 [Massilia cavernae]